MNSPHPAPLAKTVFTNWLCQTCWGPDGKEFWNSGQNVVCGHCKAHPPKRARVPIKGKGSNVKHIRNDNTQGKRFGQAKGIYDGGYAATQKENADLKALLQAKGQANDKGPGLNVDAQDKAENEDERQLKAHLRKLELSLKHTVGEKAIADVIMHQITKIKADLTDLKRKDASEQDKTLALSLPDLEELTKTRHKTMSVAEEIKKTDQETLDIQVRRASVDKIVEIFFHEGLACDEGYPHVPTMSKHGMFLSGFLLGNLENRV